MDIEQIRCFLSVAELGSFSAAAERHFISQPAVSFRIKTLEERVGEKLIERGGGRVRLTTAGSLFRVRCEEALTALERGMAEVADLSGLKRGRLVVGAIDAAGIDLLPPILKSYHERYPGVELLIRVEPSGTLVEALAAGKMDCAVITLPAPRGDLDVVPLIEETLVLLAPPGETATTASGVFAKYPLIAYPRGSVTRGLIDRALKARGLAPRTPMELAHPEAILRMVEAGLGAAVLPERFPERSGARVTEIRSFRVRRRLGLVVRRGETPSEAARVFRDLVLAGSPKRAPRSASQG